MARNIEIKAKLSNINIQRDIATSLSDTQPTILQQEDIFYKTNNGRLKLRHFSNGSGELIYYNRANKHGPKTSEYFISNTDDPKVLHQILEKTLGIRGTVKKKRELYLVGRTRIHIDQVEQLGDFLELEVVLKDTEDPKNGIKEARDLMNKLQISREDLIDKAYVDLVFD